MKIVICGSMKFIPEMKRIKKSLEKMSHEVVVPKLYDCHEILKKGENEEKFLLEKGNLIYAHFDEIKNGDAVLILNYERKNRKNYIGGNTFLEMGIAYHYHKRIFLLNDFPDNDIYLEEIKAMKPIVIHSNLKLIN